MLDKVRVEYWKPALRHRYLQVAWHHARQRRGDSEWTRSLYFPATLCSPICCEDTPGGIFEINAHQRRDGYGTRNSSRMSDSNSTRTIRAARCSSDVSETARKRSSSG